MIKYVNNIYYINGTQSTDRRNKRKIDRREQSIRAQIIRNVRKVTNGERVRQTYQSVSKHCTVLQ